MFCHIDLSDQQVRSMIRGGTIVLAGNRKLKIYGKLSCGTGKRMKRVNRVFFETEEAAMEAGFRPCGCCLKPSYAEFMKKGFINHARHRQYSRQFLKLVLSCRQYHDK